MRRSWQLSLFFVILLAVGSLAATLAAGNTPQLGLDLQGGASVVLQPTRKVSNAILDQSIEIIRNRVDALGVAEPDISRQGSNIIVQMPGVKNRDRALAIVGQTAQLRFRPVLQAGLPPGDETPTTTTAAPTTTVAPAPTTTARGATTTAAPPPTTTTTTPEQLATTPRAQDTASAVVILPDKDKTQRYRLGPTELSGRAVRTARAIAPQVAEGWSVEVVFTSTGGRQFDDLAKRFFNQQMAIVLDGVVQSAPSITSQEFNGRASITGGTGGFKEGDAKDLALVLRYGALPVTLRQETVQTVSASLGKDSLRAGLIAGLVGLALVLLYMLLYYRALGLVVLLGLGVSGMLMYSLVALLGETSGLALSLAGATGIIISVGVTVDSYVVYFERLKDEIRSGKSIRSSVERGFNRAYRTIVAADLASLIGAGLLYWLTVGPVRGFAFFLGLSTLLDLFIAYFFTRPIVALLGRNRFFTEARFFGVARGLAATGESS
ncbi:MAG: preprotein translocase subunit SecD [Actinomycetota bacterium]|jgi:preprotein translocase subunit SecD